MLIIEDLLKLKKDIPHRIHAVPIKSKPKNSGT